MATANMPIICVLVFFDAPNSNIDLCPECYGKLEKWMEANEIDP